MRSGARSHIFFLLTILVFVVVPFLFWRGTWFGTTLTDSQMQEYLSDWDKPRRIQHALVQIEQGMISGDASVKRWYPDVQKTARHPAREVRLTAAWVMGQDSTYAQFHRELQVLLRDDQPMVRRNAALSLIRFHDSSGKAEILSMLEPFSVEAVSHGKLDFQMNKGEEVKTGQLLARIQEQGKSAEVFSPVSGLMGDHLVRTGDAVRPGLKLMSIVPDDAQLWEALRALFLIGSNDDVPKIVKFLSPPYSDRIQSQARETIRKIRQK